MRKYRLIFDGINRIDRNYWINYCNIDGIHRKYEWILRDMKIIEWKWMTELIIRIDNLNIFYCVWDM